MLCLLHGMVGRLGSRVTQQVEMGLDSRALVPVASPQVPQVGRAQRTTKLGLRMPGVSQLPPSESTSPTTSTCLAVPIRVWAHLSRSSRVAKPSRYLVPGTTEVGHLRM